MPSIEVKVNGKAYFINSPKTVGEFLAELGIRPAICVVELNQNAFKYSDFKDILLSDGDILEVMSIVAGG